jgi:ABC-type uncharacterized transport system substrate-binding protein
MNRRSLFLAAAASLGAAATVSISSTPAVQSVLAWLDEDDERAQNEFRSVLKELGGSEFLALTNTRVEWIPIDYAQLERNPREILDRLVALNPEIVVSVFHHLARDLQTLLPETKQVVLSVLDPIEVNIVDDYFAPGRRTTGVTLDSLDCYKPIEVLRSFDHASDANLGVLAAAEWATPRRIALLNKMARKVGVNVSVFECESAGDVLRVLDGNEVQGVTSLYIPESLLIASSKRRAAVVQAILANGRPHLFGSLFACDLGAMAAMDTLPSLWYRPIAHALRMVLEGVDPSLIPFQRPTGWAYAINEATLKRLGVSITGEFKAMLDAPSSRIGTS